MPPCRRPGARSPRAAHAGADKAKLLHEIAARIRGRHHALAATMTLEAASR